MYVYTYSKRGFLYLVDVKQWLIPVGNLLVSERVMKIVKSWDTVVWGAPINYTHTIRCTWEEKRYIDVRSYLLCLSVHYRLYIRIYIYFFIIFSSMFSVSRSRRYTFNTVRPDFLANCSNNIVHTGYRYSHLYYPIVRPCKPIVITPHSGRINNVLGNILLCPFPSTSHVRLFAVIFHRNFQIRITIIQLHLH